MDKKFTDEEIVKAALYCTAESCETCPLRHESCAKIFAAYIADTSKQARMQDVLNDFERYISQMFTVDQHKAYNVGKSYQALKQLTKLAGEHND
jgi:hypothetical protein